MWAVCWQAICGPWCQWCHLTSTGSSSSLNWWYRVSGRIRTTLFRFSALLSFILRNQIVSIHVSDYYLYSFEFYTIVLFIYYCSLKYTEDRNWLRVVHHKKANITCDWVCVVQLYLSSIYIYKDVCMYVNFHICDIWFDCNNIIIASKNVTKTLLTVPEWLKGELRLQQKA